MDVIAHPVAASLSIWVHHALLIVHIHIWLALIVHTTTAIHVALAASCCTLCVHRALIYVMLTTGRSLFSASCSFTVVDQTCLDVPCSVARHLDLDAVTCSSVVVPYYRQFVMHSTILAVIKLIADSLLL
jgi:hypothetical protein